jgi:predicted 3-demethylubiquinone-9 3-methyltransferase (glyoxalase superfamily)
MQKTITTCLTFSKNAEEAIRFYVDIFNQAFGSSKGESKILKITHFGEEEFKDQLNVPDVPEDMMLEPTGSVKNQACQD